MNDDSFPEARAPFRGSVGPYPWLDVTLSPAGVLPRLYPAVLVLYLGVHLSPQNHLRFRPERAIKRKEAWTGFSKQPFSYVHTKRGRIPSGSFLKIFNAHHHHQTIHLHLRAFHHLSGPSHIKVVLSEALTSENVQLA